jgi:hypothetical protein
MKLKLFLFFLFIVIVSFVAPNSSESKNITTSTRNKNLVLYNNSFVRVLIDGEWWIIEYNEDGGIVSVIKEPNY